MTLSDFLKKAVVFLSPNPKQARMRRITRAHARRYSPVFTGLIGRMR